MTQCIHLLERFGDRYKVGLEEPATCFSDPWYHTIPCKYGHIYPHGDDELGFASNTNGPIAARVSDLPFARVAQAGGDGVNMVFDVQYFDQVAEIVKPKRRRRLAGHDRQRLIEAGGETRFHNGVQCGFRPPERTPKSPRDSEPEEAANARWDVENRRQARR